MTSAQAAVADDDATFNTKFTGFETLKVSNQLATATTLNLTGINGVTTVELAAGGATASSIIDNLATGGTVKLTANSTQFAVQVKDAVFNASDVLNLNLSKAGVLAAGTITAAGVETVNIASADAVAAGSAAVVNSMTLVAADATSIVVSGNNGLDLTGSTAAKVTSFDASGVVANGTADTGALLAVTYASGNTTAATTITGGAGNDVLTGNSVKDTINGGDGADTITGGTGVDTLTGGAGVDTFVVAAGGAGITGGEKITDFSIALGGDKLDLSTIVLIADVTGTDVTAAVGGAVDVTATVKNGIITIAGADAAIVDTVGEMKAIFEILDNNAAADTAAMVLNGVTYVMTDVNAGAVNDIIQLVGVTTATAMSATDGADTIFIA
jgi:S-layer protein